MSLSVPSQNSLSRRPLGHLSQYDVAGRCTCADEVEHLSRRASEILNSAAWLSSLAIFMLHMLQLVLVVFRPFPKPTGNSMQHERDMEHDLPPASGGLPGRFHMTGCRMAI
jgi:hypothetical protein